MWIVILVLLFLGAQLNLTALVPLQAGDPAAPWWVGGRLLWPFAVETRSLLPPGDALNTLTPILAMASAMCFLLAAAALLRWVVPGQWFPVAHTRRGRSLDRASGHLAFWLGRSPAPGGRRAAVGGIR